MSVRDQFLLDSQPKERNSYDHVLSIIQTKIKNQYSDIIANNTNEDIKKRLTTAIEKVIIDDGLSVECMSTTQLADRLY